MIDEKHLKDVCKAKQGEESCAFLVLGLNGWECAKFTNFEDMIRERIAEGTMRSKGDNCEGYLAVLAANDWGT